VWSMTIKVAWRAPGDLTLPTVLAISPMRPYTLRPSEQHYHDALGRPVRVVNANGDTRRQTSCAWYSIAEDEHDTHAPA